MAIKLISFSICPFVQRAVLMLRQKGIDFEVEYIDLRNKPEWFLKISPRGKVPVLQLDDGQVLFESQAICEYLEEVYPEPRLMPNDPVGRARDRAWFAMAGEDVFGPTWQVESAKDEEALKNALEKVRTGFGRVEGALEGRSWLSGDGTSFGMADVGFSSALFRAAYLKAHYDLDILDGLKNVAAWGERLCALDAVKRSVPEVWEADFAKAMAAYGSVLASRAA